MQLRIICQAVCQFVVCACFNTAYHINVLTHHFIKIALATILEFAIGS